MFSEMLKRETGGNTTTGGPFQVAGLNEVWFVHVFDSPPFFPNGCRQGFDPNGPSGEFLNERLEEQAVHVIKPGAVHPDPGKRRVGDLTGHRTVAFDLRKVPHAPEQAVGDPGGATGASRDFRGAGSFHRNLKNPGGPENNGL